jgi:carboxyl-terminal processing protease
MPDIFVPIDTSSYSKKINRLLIDGNFNGFVYNYYLQHRKQVDKYTSAADYAQHFNDTNEMWEAFVNYTAKDSVNLNTVSAKEKESLEIRLKAYLARFRWRNNGFYNVINNDDVVIKKALDVVAK